MSKKNKPKKSSYLNRKARFKYEISDTLEAGISLTGSEVKSIRLGRVSLGQAFVVIRGGEAYVINMNIPAYEFTHERDYDPTRPRKLLLHKQQIHQLASKVESSGQTLVPLKLYSKRGRFKLEIGLGKGRKEHSKKQLLKERDIARDTARQIKDMGY